MYLQHVSRRRVKERAWIARSLTEPHRPVFLLKNDRILLWIGSTSELAAVVMVQ